MTDILAHSALYQELKDFPETPETPETPTIAGNPVIIALATEGPDISELFRYTRAVPRGYIHACLAGFSFDQLTAARELLEFWQFPKEWVRAVDEELEFREFLVTGVLPPLLAAKATEIAGRFDSIYGLNIYPHDVFIATGNSNSCLGRKLNKSDCNKFTMCYASFSGYVELVHWLRENDCPWDKVVFEAAVTGNHISMLEYLYENGCPWNEDTCSYAALSGNLLALQWLHEHGCPWDVDTCSRAALGGHLEVLQWVRAKGCPWDNNVIRYARRFNHEHIVEWALANGFPH